jgi:hypothetical protein
MPTNALLAGFASTPMWIATAVDPSTLQLVLSVVTPIVLMFLGKLLDLALKVYMEKRGGKKDQSGKSD